MRDRHENSVRLSSVLHVFKLKINLLSERRMYKKDLQGSFDDKGLYMHDKRKKQMIKTLECEGVYIIKRIVNDLNEFALLLAMQRDVSLAFSAMHSSMNRADSMNLNNLINLNYSASHVNAIHHENEIKINYS